MRKISQLVLLASFVGSLLLGLWTINQWEGLAGRDRVMDDLGAVITSLLPKVQILAILVLAGYVGTFLSRQKARPVISIVLAFMGLGIIGGVVGRQLLSQYEFVREEIPSVDALFWASVIGGSIILPALVMAFEAVNRWIWWTLARGLDDRGMAGPALLASQVCLLFDPGHESTLRSVALARFRQGARGPVLDTLQTFYQAGQRDNDIVEALAKAAKEAGDSDSLLRHLRELCELNPKDEEIRRILLANLIDIGQWREALALMENLGVGDDAESLETYATALIQEGYLEKAAVVARRLGEAEGIPFRKSQKILREVLSQSGENVNALNTLAAQAERMALRDQRLRWLEKSYQADNRQEEIREILIDLYKEINDLDKLETMLADHVAHHPKDDQALVEYATVLHRNEKSDEALQRLAPLTAGGSPNHVALLAEGRIHYDNCRFTEGQRSVRRILENRADSPLREEAEALMARLEKGMLSTEVATALEAANANPTDLPVQLNALAKLLEESHSDKVIPLVDRIVSSHPAGRDQVLDLIGKAAQKPDTPFPILNLYADLLVGRNRFDEALDVVRIMADRSIDKVGAMRDGAQKILRRSPHHLATLRTLGDRYLAYGRFTEMIHSYALYLSHGGEETPQIDNALARAYLNLGDYENAKRFVTQVIAQNPEDGALLQQVIPLALEADKPEDAAEFMKKLEIIAAKDPETRRLKEKVNTGLGERRLAYLKKEMESGRGDSATLEQLGDIARTIGNYNEGITYYQRASRDRENPGLAKRCLTKLALCYAHKRLDDLASETLRDLTVSLDDDPNDLGIIMDVLYETGNLFLEMKMYAKAERIFKQLCKIDAGYRDVLAKVESLRV